jgi:hypothetical protein
MRTILIRTGLIVTALGLGATLSGCAQETNCEELDSCGGPMPTGEWRLGANHPSCSEDLYIPATDTRLLGGEITPARQPTIEPALFDWCLLLLTGAADGDDVQVKPPRFYYESTVIGAAQITYTPGANPDFGNFTAAITKTGRFTLDFPAACVRAFGATDRPDLAIDPSGANVPVCERLQVPLAESGIGEGSYPNADCYANLDASDPRLTPEQAERQRQNVKNGYPADPDGCLCEFDVTETGGPSGTYARQGNVILHNPSGNFASRATYCNKGDRLELTGADGAFLFNISGLRTMDLGPAATTPIPFPPP